MEIKKRSVNSSFSELKRHKPGRETAAWKHLHSTLDSNWDNIQISGLFICIWAFMFWQIYCITS